MLRRAACVVFCLLLTSVAHARIDLIDKIYFESNRAIIRRVMYPALDDMVAMFKSRPTSHASKYKVILPSVSADVALHRAHEALSQQNSARRIPHHRVTLACRPRRVTPPRR